MRSQPDDIEAEFPEVFAACAVTRAMTRTKSDSSMFEPGEKSLSDFPLPASQEDLKGEQKADLSLRSLFEQVVADAELESSACRCFLHDTLLVRKWIPFRESVLKVAHDGSGHLGVRKKKDRVLRHFFLAIDEV